MNLNFVSLVIFFSSLVSSIFSFLSVTPFDCVIGYVIDDVIDYVIDDIIDYIIDYVIDYIIDCIINCTSLYLPSTVTCFATKYFSINIPCILYLVLHSAIKVFTDIFPPHPPYPYPTFPLVLLYSNCRYLLSPPFLTVCRISQSSPQLRLHYGPTRRR